MVGARQATSMIDIRSITGHIHPDGNVVVFKHLFWGTTRSILVKGTLVMP